MVGNNICSWTAQAYEVYEGGNESPVGDFSDSFRLLGSRAYNGGMRGTSTAPILYNVPVNANFTPRNYVLKYGDQTVHSVAQQPFGNTCSRAAAQLGTTINGSLSVNDCAWLDADSRVDFYEIDGVAGELYALEFSSPLAEKMILSFRDNNQLGYGFDSISAGDSFPRIPRENLGQFPSTGKYTLRVSGKQGAYQIKLISVGPAGCVYNIDRSGEALMPAGGGIIRSTSRAIVLTVIGRSAALLRGLLSRMLKVAKALPQLILTSSPNSGAPRQAVITVADVVLQLIRMRLAPSKFSKPTNK